MIFVYATAIILLIAGAVTGKIIRQHKTRQFIKAGLSKSKYEILHDLSPIEFGSLVKGTFSKHVLLGEIIYLFNTGVVDLTRNENGKLLVRRTTNYSRTPTSKNSVYVGYLPIKYQSFDFILWSNDFEAIIRMELVKKGWLQKNPKYKKKLLSYSTIYKNILIILGVDIVVFALLSILSDSSEATYIIMVVLNIVAIIIYVFILLFFSLRNTIIENSGIIINNTKEYKQKYNDINGLYIYMKISGQDTFLPDYSVLDFTGLDDLYPYYVAAGLDKKIFKYI